MNTEIIDIDKSVNIDFVVDALKNVFDPEIYHSIYDMGLIYKIKIENNTVDILMTLTSVNCPEAQTLPEEAKNMVKSLCPNAEVNLEITFEPAWDVENMSDEVKLKLGIL